LIFGETIEARKLRRDKFFPDLPVIVKKPDSKFFQLPT